MKCCVCSKKIESSACVTLRLSDSEKESVRQMGQEPQNEYEYCRPCFRLLSNPEQGAQLIRGTFQLALRSEGVPDAESKARKYYDFLIRGANHPTH
jgi:hypothetical protein